jgi:hypothetical protein
MKRLTAAALALVLTAMPALAYDLIVNNRSKYDIHELYVSKSKSAEWGPDQLAKHTVDAGGKFTLRNVPEGVYDLKLVDEDGTECVLENADVDGSKEWNVTSAMLERCDKFGG